jgi:hypothetical protein
MQRLRDRILARIFPDLWYKLRAEFEQEEIDVVAWLAAQDAEKIFPPESWTATEADRNSNILCRLHLRMNTLHRMFYDPEYEKKVMKEWS